MPDPDFGPASTRRVHAERLTIHGTPVTFRRAGEGPAVVLVHGVTSSSRTWRSVLPDLARDHQVIAPDLLGHGASAKPRGDYSMGAYASGIRDVLSALDVPSATIVGHSLGGGIAMQFAYQFPSWIERLVLVDSGGLGADVSLVLRAATLPGAEWVLPVLAGAPARAAGALTGTVLGRLGLRANADVRGLAEGFESLGSPEARRAFLHTVRAVIDVGGQRVDARDRLYLAQRVPSLVVWGTKDRIIPFSHGVDAHERMPGSRLEPFVGAGHFPFNDDPEHFVRVLRAFVAETEAAHLDEREMGELLRGEARGTA